MGSWFKRGKGGLCNPHSIAEAILGSHGTLEGSRATLSRWRGANLVSVGTVIGSRRVCLVSHEAKLGSWRTSVVSSETYFLDVAKGTLATLTFLCLHICRGFLLPPVRSCSNFSWSKLMTNVSAIDPGVWSSHCDTWFSAVENNVPSGVSHLVFYWKSIRENLQNIEKKITSN